MDGGSAGVRLPVPVSAFGPADPLPGELYRTADANLHHAKRDGRDRVVG
jgi:GGDEF domain-containing protein